MISSHPLRTFGMLKTPQRCALAHILYSKLLHNQSCHSRRTSQTPIRAEAGAAARKVCGSSCRGSPPFYVGRPLCKATRKPSDATCTERSSILSQMRKLPTSWTRPRLAGLFLGGSQPRSTSAAAPASACSAVRRARCNLLPACLQARCDNIQS